MNIDQEMENLQKQILQAEEKFVEGENEQPPEPAEGAADPELQDPEGATEDKAAADPEANPEDDAINTSDEEDEELSDTPPKDHKAWASVRKKAKAAKEAAEEERQLRQKREEELGQLRERLARLEGRDEERQKPKLQEPEDPEPSAEDEPFEYLQWKLRQAEKKIKEVEEKATKAEDASMAEGARRGIKVLEDQYIKENNITDYDSRISYLKNVEAKLIRLHYPNATQQQIDNHLDKERIRISADCYSNGQNPAEYFSKLAEIHGYKKEFAPKKPTAGPNIGAINKNMQKNSSLLGTSSADDTGGVSSQKLVTMAMDELLKNEDALDKEIKRRDLQWLNEAV